MILALKGPIAVFANCKFKKKKTPLIFEHLGSIKLTYTIYIECRKQPHISSW